MTKIRVNIYLGPRRNSLKVNSSKLNSFSNIHITEVYYINTFSCKTLKELKTYM